MGGVKEMTLAAMRAGIRAVMGRGRAYRCVIAASVAWRQLPEHILVDAAGCLGIGDPCAIFRKPGQARCFVGMGARKFPQACGDFLGLGLRDLWRARGGARLLGGRALLCGGRAGSSREDQAGQEDPAGCGIRGRQTVRHTHADGEKPGRCVC